MRRVSGTLYWQLNDCWPVASWSSIDYFGRWKALHYAARRFYAPLLLSVEDEGTSMAVHVTSDLVESWQGLVRWTVETLDGNVLASGQEEVTAAPLGSTAVRVLDLDKWVTEENRREIVLVCELLQDGQRLALTVNPVVPSKHLSLVDPALEVEVEEAGEGLVVEVTARSLARFVELSLEGADIVFGDNYFDLPAEWTFKVNCPLPAGWSVERVREALHVRSLYDSFA
jgi:beta-mannosidase